MSKTKYCVETKPNVQHVSLCETYCHSALFAARTADYELALFFRNKLLLPWGRYCLPSPLFISPAPQLSSRAKTRDPAPSCKYRRRNRSSIRLAGPRIGVPPPAGLVRGDTMRIAVEANPFGDSMTLRQAQGEVVRAISHLYDFRLSLSKPSRSCRAAVKRSQIPPVLLIQRGEAPTLWPCHKKTPAVAGVSGRYEI